MGQISLLPSLFIALWPPVSRCPIHVVCVADTVLESNDAVDRDGTPNSCHSRLSLTSVLKLALDAPEPDTISPTNGNPQDTNPMSVTACSPNLF